MILGTAGHIDHGKTALVRALTGVDTDRLPEEKRRGITIDLGFAPLTLPGGDVLGVVDVPGHEAFVRTMLAGASGIDVAMLVIAADEGPMPQTREHLAILELLRVPRLVVALTKSDLVEPDWLALVSEDVRELLKDTRYDAAVIVPTSVVSGTGLDELRATLQAIAAELDHPGPGQPGRGGGSAVDLFRLPIDRAFSVRGTGTVVTGTVWSGTLAVDDTVRVMPAGALARVRGIQTHGRSVARVSRAQRAAIALAGIEADAASRGTTLVSSPDWAATLVLRADVTMLAAAPALRPRTRVRLHLGTADVGARVVGAGGPVTPDSARAVRIVLDEPMVACAGDRFVLRSASPLATIGGGVITDPFASRRSRPMRAPGLPADERLEVFARESGAHGLAAASLGIRLGMTAADAAALAAKSRAVARVGERWYSAELLDTLRTRLVQLVKRHHESHPLEPGVPRQDVRSRLGIESALFEHVLDDAVAAGKVEATAGGADIRAHGRSAELSAPQQKIADSILAALDAAGTEPPSVGELEVRFGKETLAVLRHLDRQKRVVQVEDARYYAPAAVSLLLEKLERAMSGKGELAPTYLREALGFSRKFLIPFLEYCDRRGYTARQGAGRVWRGAKARV